VAWVQSHIEARGGRADRLFLMGHSAGAQLAARVAVDPQWLAAAGGQVQGVCGTVAVSGAGYDLADIDTYRKGIDPIYFSERFGGSRMDGTWWRDASVVPFVDRNDPPFLTVYATGEGPAMARQSQLLDARLREAGVPAALRTVKGSSHERMVLELSRDHATAGPAVLQFVAETPCPRAPYDTR
jgi:acetyl esterase/lipase